MSIAQGCLPCWKKHHEHNVLVRKVLIAFCKGKPRRNSSTEVRNGNREYHRRTLYIGLLGSLCIQPMLTQLEKSPVGWIILYQLSSKKLPHKYPKFYGKKFLKYDVFFPGMLVCVKSINKKKTFNTSRNLQKIKIKQRIC